MIDRQSSTSISDSGIEEKRVALDWERLRFERKKAAMEFRLKRNELADHRGKGWKELLASPFTLAIVGGFITVMSTIVSNHLTVSANLALEATKAELAAKGEAAKAVSASQAANQTLQADLIKKFVESPKTETVRENLRFLVDAGLLPDYATRISAYLANNPDVAPQVGATSEPNSPVIGGTPSSRGDWPWLVGIRRGTYDGVVCQATLLGPRTVLTVAHCVTKFDVSQELNATQSAAVDDIKVIATGDIGGQKATKEMQVSKIFVHPSYAKKRAPENNIAVLELKESLPPPYVLISQARASDPAPGTLAMVAAIAGSQFEFLEAKIPIVDYAVCRASMGPDVDPTTNLCAGFAAGGVDTCRGSSGGPLVVTDQAGRKYQVGITSWGVGCGLPNKYGVYTRVSAFADWIKQIVPDLPIKAGADSKQ